MLGFDVFNRLSDVLCEGQAVMRFGSDTGLVEDLSQQVPPLLLLGRWP